MFYIWSASSGQTRQIQGTPWPIRDICFECAILSLLIPDCQTQLQWREGTISAQRPPYGPCTSTQWLSYNKLLNGHNTNSHFVDTRCLLRLKLCTKCCIKPWQCACLCKKTIKVIKVPPQIDSSRVSSTLCTDPHTHEKSPTGSSSRGKLSDDLFSSEKSGKTVA